LRLHVSSSSNNSTSVAVDRFNRRTGTFRCRVPDCLLTFRRACQLSTHYTGFHPCDFSPPRDPHDLEVYNQYMSSYQPEMSGKRKRKRSTSTSQHAKTKKRARTKSG